MLWNVQVGEFAADVFDFTEDGQVFPGRDPAVLDANLSRWRTRRLG